MTTSTKQEPAASGTQQVTTRTILDYAEGSPRTVRRCMARSSSP